MCGCRTKQTETEASKATHNLRNPIRHGQDLYSASARLAVTFWPHGHCETPLDLCLQEDGKIVKTGDASLAKELESGGYAAVRGWRTPYHE